MLDLGKVIEPCDHDLRLHFQLDNLFRQSGDNVGKGQTLCNLECVDSRQTGCDVARAQKCAEDLFDGVGWWGGNAVVDGSNGDGFPYNVLFGDLGDVLWLKWCAWLT